MVIGETARAANFALYGYQRATNPKLAARRDVIVLPPTEACATSTAASLPCMFSYRNRESYRSRPQDDESLASLASRLGVAVQYVGNNFGDCKGVCRGVPSLYTQNQPEAVEGQAYCNNRECFDEILLPGLKHSLAGMPPEGGLILLHQNGSHGPLYDRRYPDRYRQFVPVCDGADVRHCSREELVNGYDNTILYTDAVLDGLIGILADDPRPVLLIYLSDHGESLGEGGLYLHGLPYDLAPPEQKTVPFLLWGSPSFWQGEGIDRGCVAATTDPGHDNLFHSLLGLLRISAPEYRAEEDLFAACR